MSQKNYPLDYERLFLHCPASNVQMHITFHSIITADQLADAINRAIKHRATLCSTVRTEADGVAYFVPHSPQPVTVSMIEPSTTVDTGNTVTDLCDYVVLMQQKVLDIRNGEWIRSEMSVVDGCSVWLLTWNHVAGDGMSVLYFIRDVQEALLHPELQFAREELTLCNAAELPGKLPGMIRFGIRRFNKSYQKNGNSFTSDDQNRLLTKYWAKRLLSCSRKTLSPQQLHALLDSTHAHGVTLTSALITAFMLCDTTVKSAGLAVNIRPDGCEVAANWAGGISTDRPKKALPFWEFAKELHNQMQKKLQREENKYFLIHFFHEINPNLTDSVYYAASDGYNNRTSKTLAKMFGYMDNPIGSSFTNLMRAPIEPSLIRDIAFYPPMIANACKLFGLVTVGDTLTITYQSFSAKQQTQQVLTQILQIMESAC